MSFLKFWKKGKKKQPRVMDFPEGGFSTAETPADEGGGVSVQERSRRSKHQLSISRSGRYKSKKRERGAIPEPFQGNPDQDHPETLDSKLASGGNTCRDVQQQIQDISLGNNNNQSRNPPQMAV